MVRSVDDDLDWAVYCGCPVRPVGVAVMSAEIAGVVERLKKDADFLDTVSQWVGMIGSPLLNQPAPIEDGP